MRHPARSSMGAAGVGGSTSPLSRRLGCSFCSRFRQSTDMPNASVVLQDGTPHDVAQLCAALIKDRWSRAWRNNRQPVPAGITKPLPPGSTTTSVVTLHTLVTAAVSAWRLHGGCTSWGLHQPLPVRHEQRWPQGEEWGGEGRWDCGDVRRKERRGAPACRRSPGALRPFPRRKCLSDVARCYLAHMDAYWNCRRPQSLKPPSRWK